MSFLDGFLLRLIKITKMSIGDYAKRQLRRIGEYYVDVIDGWFAYFISGSSTLSRLKPMELTGSSNARNALKPRRKGWHSGIECFFIPIVFLRNIFQRKPAEIIVS